MVELVADGSWLVCHVCGTVSQVLTRCECGGLRHGNCECTCSCDCGCGED